MPKKDINDPWGDDLKNLFKGILGSEVKIKDNIDATEEKVFCLFIKKLDETFEMENKVYETAGIDLNKVNDGLWFVVENSFRFLYGESATELIIWYVFNRKDENGEVEYLEDEDGKKYILDTPQKLWKQIKGRYRTGDEPPLTSF